MNFFIIPLFFFCIFTSPSSSSLNSDGLSLLALKAAINDDPTHSLATWTESDSTPCRWAGVSCNSDHRVTSIFLPEKNLSGYLPSELGALVYLRHLSLPGNNFSKPIPIHLFNATSLISIDLSHNSLAGPLPETMASLKFLTFLDLSSNSLNGSLPESLSNLTNLAGTLNLSYNHFSGQIPASYGLFQVMVSLDLRHNNLTGKIPQVGSLLNQGPTAFTGNPFLCGFPLESQCSDPEAQNPRVLSNPDSPLDPGSSTGSSKRTSGSFTVALIAGVSAIVGVMLFSTWVYRKKWRSGEGKRRKDSTPTEVVARVSVGEEEGQDGKFVVMDEGFCLELEDLLRASAYVVGKSKSGIVYKVVVGRGSGAAAGSVVAVRRLSEGDGAWRLKEFETEVDIIGRVQHPNIVKLRAYYYANDEKLLVSDFISNGSLYSALHDTGGPTNPSRPLSWAARLKIAQGTARGLAHIHECNPRKYVHGDIRSSKILLDNDLRPVISGFGLNRLVLGLSSKSLKSASRKLSNSSQLTMNSSKNSSNSSSNLYYVAPEVRISGHKPTTKCDVYSFGIVLLEILTGRAPDGGPDDDGKGLESLVRKVFREERPLTEIIDPALLQEVYAKKQVVAAFHIALNCTELDPEVRPKMRMVSDSLDRIKLRMC